MEQEKAKTADQPKKEKGFAGVYKKDKDDKEEVMPVITKEDGTVDQEKFKTLEDQIKKEQRDKKIARMTEQEKAIFFEEEKKAEEEVARSNIAQAKIGQKIPESNGPNLKELFAKHIDQIKLDYIDEQTGLTP